jgi:hypothetical protein
MAGENHACKLDQNTLSSTGFHFADEYGDKDFISPVGFIPAFQVRAEEAFNAQPKDPDIPTGNADGEAAPFRRMPGSTEPPNDLAPVVGSSPRSCVSVPSPHLDVPHANLFGKWFRQVIPLGIRQIFSLGTNDIPLLHAPRLPHTLGALGPKPQAVPQLFARAVEAALGVSFNAQSQAPDIPEISTRNQLSIYTGSFNAQSKAPDISSRASKEELSACFNAQDQAPDDPCYEQASHLFPLDVFSKLSSLSLVIPKGCL